MVLSLIWLFPSTSIPAITEPDEINIHMISASYRPAICLTNPLMLGRTIRLSRLVMTLVPTLITILCLYIIVFYCNNRSSSHLPSPVERRKRCFLDLVFHLVAFHGIQGCPGGSSF